MKSLKTDFSNREELIAYVQSLSPSAQGSASPIQGGRQEAQKRLQNIDPLHYAKSRNFGSGKVTKLSPYIHHGIVTLHDVRQKALAQCQEPEQITKFIQELSWRDFWQRVATQHPEWLWQDIENYKTGFAADDYQKTLPKDIATGKTGVACIDHFIGDLLHAGYAHNHARMYLASYVVHFRRVRWQAGARWFLKHLLDGDEASNNFSWQWVASTFSQKPYSFNLENVDKYFGEMVDTSEGNNAILNASYDALTARLFPQRESND